MNAIKNVLLDEMIAAAVAAASLLDGASVQLVRGGPDDDVDNVVADFETSDFTGNAAVVLGTWIAAIDADGRPYMRAPAVSWTSGDAVNLPQTAIGAIILNGTDVLHYQKFDSPVNIVAVGQVIDLVPVVSIADGIPQMQATTD